MRNPFFGTDIINCIHKRVKVLLYLCSMEPLKNVGTRSLYEFGNLQQRMEWEKWITYKPI